MAVRLTADFRAIRGSQEFNGRAGEVYDDIVEVWLRTCPDAPIQDADDAPAPAVSAPVATTPAEPKRNASRGAWAEYALSLDGVEEADIADLTRDELADQFGTA